MSVATVKTKVGFSTDIVSLMVFTGVLGQKSALRVLADPGSAFNLIRTEIALKLRLNYETVDYEAGLAIAAYRTLQNKLCQNQLFAKQEEMYLRGTYCIVEYLGHVVSEQGVDVDPQKVQAIVSLSTPADTHTVRQFLVLVGFYRRFIRDFATLAAPLTSLLTMATVFRWDSACETAFRALIHAVTTAPVLCIPNMDEHSTLVLETDASALAIGGVLLNVFMRNTDIKRPKGL